MPEGLPAETVEHSRDRRSFTNRVWTAVLILAAMAGAVVVLWLGAKVALLFFAAVLLAILLRTLCDWVSRVTHLGVRSSLAIVIIGILLIFGAVGWLLAAPISNQVEQLTQQLPQAMARLEDHLRQYSLGKALLETIHQPKGIVSQAGGFLGKIRGALSITIDGVVGILIILFCGFYLTTQPELYVKGFLRLLPRHKRDGARDVLMKMGAALRAWLLGQIISMSIIGVLTWVGLHFLGIPLAAALALLAGLLDFVPVVGPWVAGILSCLLALLVSPWHAIYVACLFTALHLFEGHVLIPQVQKFATRLPPVLTILAMLLFATLFGFLGLFLATPLLVLVMVMAQRVYVEDFVDKKS